MDKRYLQVEGHDDLVRDTESNCNCKQKQRCVSNCKTKSTKCTKTKRCNQKCE